MLTVKMLALVLRLHGTVTETQWDGLDEAQLNSEAVSVQDLEHNLHVLEGGSQTMVVDPTGQRRLFAQDGSITVTENDGRVWKL